MSRYTLAFARFQMRLYRDAWIPILVAGFMVPLASLQLFDDGIGDGRFTRVVAGGPIFGVVMLVLRGGGYQLRGDRLFGYLDLLATTGLTRQSYLAGNALAALMISLVPLAALGFQVAWGGAPAPRSWAWLLPFFLIVVASFSTAVLIAGRAGRESYSGTIVELAVVLNLALCPVLYPANRVPEAIAPVVALLPATLGADLMEAAWLGMEWDAVNAGLLAGWTLALALIGMRGFQWTERV